jgi:hypothetical protein
MAITRLTPLRRVAQAALFTAVIALGTFALGATAKSNADPAPTPDCSDTNKCCVYLLGPQNCPSEPEPGTSTGSGGAGPAHALNPNLQPGRIGPAPVGGQGVG